ncbi:hypothetical protein GQ54DRAFT_293328 [Martensiomyces pterosporus]|nr:hypothetical protein GQ54DRAFT_293328 [Martensiomyces pterosporus]
MMHIARQLYVWEQRTFRRVLASTTAYYPFNAGPYTAAVANMLGSWRGHQSTELVIQCVNSCFLSISCRVPYPFANDDRDKSLYPPGYQDSGGNDLSFHLTLAEVDPKTSQIIRIASTWPWVFSHTGRSAQEAVERNLGHEEHLRAHKMGAKNVGFELSTSLSRWLRTLQARINLTGNPLAALSIIVQLMPIHHVVSSISSQASIQSLLPSLQLGSKDSLIQLKFEGLLDGDEMDVSTRSSKAAPTPDRLPNAENKDEAARAAGERALPMEDQSHLVLRRLVYAHNYIRQAFESVADLNVMHMYTAADNIRLVFNSRYVVDLRLVSNDLLHLSDVVAAARSFAGPPTIYGGASVAPPAPLVTAATEPIPLFAEWLNNMSSSIKLNWEKLEKGVSALMRHVYIAAPSSSSSSSLSTGTGDPGEKVRMFQRNMYRLRPDASKIEQFLFKFRELNNKQYSAKSPTFVPLPPSAILCSKSHLVPILRSLMQWILQSVHVLDSLESAIVKTQESFVHATSGGVARHAVMLFSVDELLVDRQQMIVGFTGSRGSVRCEFVMKTGVKRDDAGEAGAGESATKDMDKSMSMDADGQQQQQQQTGDASASAYGNDDPVAPLLSGLFSVPENLMDVMWDVRILPIVHPPKGVSERVATFLAESFNKQKTSIGQRAGVLVRLAALPPHLLEDTAKIAVDMKGKVDVCAISEGHEYEIRLDAGKAEAMFTLRLCGSDQKTWARVVVVYALLTGVAQVRYVQYETPAREDVVQVRFKKTGDDGRVESVAMKPVDAWSLCLDGVVKKLDDMTAFTLDNGKDGKSRWFDIVSSLYAAQLEQLGL